MKLSAILATAAFLYAGCTSSSTTVTTSSPKTSAPVVSEEPKKITKDNFETLVLKAGKPILVDFYADWCFTCGWLDEDMPKLQDYFDGKMTFYKFDVMSDEEFVKRYEVGSLPALRLFYKGKVICRTSGYGGKKDYEPLKDILEGCLKTIGK